VIDLANDTTSGLASYVYTNNISRIWRLSDALQYGMIGVNQPLVSSSTAPFGGMKESGMGREGSHYGVRDYLDIKCVHMGGLIPTYD
jgi:acyl-CoA reductase-like NAD-dependent aldehyde dehydrogenase